MSFLLKPMKDKFRLGTRLSFRDWALMRLSVGARGAGFVYADGWRAAGLENGEREEDGKEEEVESCRLQVTS
jgi:hypothetical protein